MFRFEFAPHIVRFDSHSLWFATLSPFSFFFDSHFNRLHACFTSWMSSFMWFQEHLAPSNYIRITTVSDLFLQLCLQINLLWLSFLVYAHFQDLDAYCKGCRFLPKINNELYKNSTYKARFSSLENLVLIMVYKLKFKFLFLGHLRTCHFRVSFCSKS